MGMAQTVGERFYPPHLVQGNENFTLSDDFPAGPDFPPRAPIGRRRTRFPGKTGLPRRTRDTAPTAPARPLQGKARAVASPSRAGRDAPSRPLRHGPCLRKAPQGPCLRCACPDGHATPSRPLRHAFCRAKAAPSLRLPAPKRDPLTAAFHGTLPPPVRTAAHMSDNTPAAARSAPTRSPGSGAIAHALPARPVVALVVALIIAGLTYRRLLGVPLRFAPGRAAPGSASLRPRAAQAAQTPRPPPRVALRPSASLTPPRSPARCASSACPASLRAPLGNQSVRPGCAAPHGQSAPAPPRLSVAARRAAAAARPPLPVLAPARLPVRPPKGGSR